MCGIFGVVSASGKAPAIPDLKQAVGAMTHRGPDDSGVWASSDGAVVLGHRRLSILDLSPTGCQPMHDAADRLHVTFNGEIYNHPELRRLLAADGYLFRSSSDTEVILAAYQKWGTDCLARLNGMFSFGLYDEARRLVFLARDRAGEKPLFYSVEQDSLSFASELKALLGAPGAKPRGIDPLALDCYLAFGYVPGAACIVRGFNKLPAAHAMTFSMADGETRVWRYWSLPAAPREGSSDEDLLAESEQLLEDAVRRQLIADVPVGVLLSGGVDSSLTTAMAARTGHRVKTFTVSFPGEGIYDESAHARLIATHFGTDHVELEAEPSNVGLVPALARQFDEPMADSSMVPTYLLSTLVQQHCKVVLGGDGGDELFGGYIHHDRLLWLANRSKRLPVSLRRIAGALAERMLPAGAKGRNWLRACAADFDSELPLIASLFSPRERMRLLGKSFNDHGRIGSAAEAIWRARTPAADDLVQRATRMDFENYLPEDILVKVDRASMLASLEVRAPLLDQRVVEFAFGKVPSRLKATTHERKILPKRLARRVLPPAFDTARKQGFSLPLSQWLRGGPWRDFFHDVLLGSASTLFDRTLVRDLFKGQQRGRNNSERLFALVLFELWRREYRVFLEA